MGAESPPHDFRLKGGKLDPITRGQPTSKAFDDTHRLKAKMPWRAPP